MKYNQWITDRLPTEADADSHDGYVWVTRDNGLVVLVVHMMWDCVTGEPWMHFTRPEPYVKPKRYVRERAYRHYMDSSSWRVRDTKTDTLLNLSMQSEELAVKFETFMNEVMS